MPKKRQVQFVILLAVAIGFPGCVPRLKGPDQVPTARPEAEVDAAPALSTLELQQNSQRISLDVAADGSVSFAEHSPLQGKLNAGPILDAEGRKVGRLQVLLHLGRYYIVADGFDNLWEITPEPGGLRATYRPIRLPGKELSGVRLSHYGPPGRACVRIDTEEGGTWFVTRSGEADEKCL